MFAAAHRFGEVRIGVRSHSFSGAPKRPKIHQAVAELRRLPVREAPHRQNQRERDDREQHARFTDPVTEGAQPTGHELPCGCVYSARNASLTRSKNDFSSIWSPPARAHSSSSSRSCLLSFVGTTTCTVTS